MPLLREPARELGGGRRLPRALQTDHHDAGRSLARPRDRLALVRHEGDELVVANLDELLARAHSVRGAAVANARLDRLPERLALDAGEKPLDDPELDIGLQERETDLAQRGLDVVLIELREAGQAVLSLPKPLGECVEHGAGS